MTNKQRRPICITNTVFLISPHKLFLENYIHPLRVSHFIKNQPTYEGAQDKRALLTQRNNQEYYFKRFPLFTQ